MPPNCQISYTQVLESLARRSAREGVCYSISSPYKHSAPTASIGHLTPRYFKATTSSDEFWVQVFTPFFPDTIKLPLMVDENGNEGNFES